MRRFRSIRVRLAVLIILAMTALVALLVYQQLDERSHRREESEANLQRLAVFAANTQRERFEAAERLLVLASQAQSIRTAALQPESTEAHDACTRGLFVLDQLLPGTRFALWDTTGASLCSSRAAKQGAFSAADKLWFGTATERGDFATGGFELSNPEGQPSIGFGLPIRDSAEGNIIAYLSTALLFDEGVALVSGASLPETGRLSIVDQGNIVVTSTELEPGRHVPTFGERFGSLAAYPNTGEATGSGRYGAAARITDADDAYVAVLVSASETALAPSVLDTLLRGLTPVAIIAVLTLVAVWLLAQQWILQPVQALVKANEALASGNLSARARVPRGVAEFEQLGAAFNEMAATRERASHAKDEFLGLVSHELKTPITMAMGNAAVLKQHGDALDPEQRQAALNDIYDSTARLTTIIDNMLALARLERGAELDNEPLALLRMAQQAAEQQARNAPGRRVLVSGDGTLLGVGGETYVEQILSNLIGNALKYSPAAAPVEVHVEGDGVGAVVRVLDRGAGIDDEEREIVFQPFYRSKKTSTYAEGVGIGLSVCKRLVEAMGGSIWSRPREGGGSEFGFRLALAETDEPATALETEGLAKATT